MTGSSPKHILIHHVRDGLESVALRRGRPAGLRRRPQPSPDTAHLLPTELFQRLNCPVSVVPILALEVFVEVIIFITHLVNAEP